MTKEEAICKIELTANKDYDAIPAKNLLAALEALDLIKFDEEKSADSPSMVINKELDGYCFQPMLKADKIINALMQAGYLIINKKGYRTDASS